MKSIEERVKEVIINVLVDVDPDKIKSEAKFTDDFGADSLETVELMMALEEEFNLKIPDEDAEKITTVGEAIEYIKKNAPKEEV